MKPVLKELLLVFSGAPGALGVLAGVLTTFSDKVDLGPLLSKIISRYLFVSQKFWDSLVPQFIRDLIPLPHHQISFLFLILVPVLVNIIIRDRVGANPQDTPRFWAAYSVVCIFVFAFLFGVQTDVYSGAPAALIFIGIMLLDFVVFVVLLIFFGALAWILIKRMTGLDPAKQRFKRSFAIGLGALVAFLVEYQLLMLIPPNWSEPLDSSSQTPQFLLAGATILSSFAVWIERIKAPAYVLTCAVGLLFFGWIGDVVLPELECWLDEPMNGQNLQQQNDGGNQCPDASQAR